MGFAKIGKMAPPSGLKSKIANVLKNAPQIQA
jgi:hypothetical protein